MKSRMFKDILIITLLTILSQSLIFITNSFVTSKIGINESLDTFNFLKVLFNFIINSIGILITTILIPKFICLEKNKQIIDKYLTLLIILFTLIMFGLYNISESILIKHLSYKNLKEIDDTLKIFIKIYTIIFVLNIFSSIYQANKKMVYTKVVQFSISIFLFLWIFNIENTSAKILSQGMLLSNLLGFFLYLFNKNTYIYKFKFNFNFKDEKLVQTLKISIPVFFSMSIYQLSLVVDSILAGKLGEGNITILSYSSSLIGILTMLFVNNINSYIYPQIIEIIENRYLLKEKIQDFLMYMLLILILIITYFIFIGKEILIVLFKNGKVLEMEIQTIYLLTVIYSLNLLFISGRDLMYRCFYAKKNTMVPFRNSIISVISNIIISIVLYRYIGIYGIVLGTLSSGIISFLRVYYIFNKNIVKIEISFKRMYLILKFYIKTIIILSIFNIIEIDNISIIIKFGGISLDILVSLFILKKWRYFK